MASQLYYDWDPIHFMCPAHFTQEHCLFTDTESSGGCTVKGTGGRAGGRIRGGTRGSTRGTIVVRQLYYDGAPIHCWCPAYFTQKHCQFTDTVGTGGGIGGGIGGGTEGKRGVLVVL